MTIETKIKRQVHRADGVIIWVQRRRAYICARPECHRRDVKGTIDLYFTLADLPLGMAAQYREEDHADQKWYCSYSPFHYLKFCSKADIYTAWQCRYDAGPGILVRPQVKIFVIGQIAYAHFHIVVLDMHRARPVQDPV